MQPIVFRAPGSSCSLESLLIRAVGDAAREGLHTLVSSGAVYVDGHSARSLGQTVPGGVQVRLEWPRAPISPADETHAEHFVALAPRPAWPGGTLESKSRAGSYALTFAVGAVRAGIAELDLRCDPLPVSDVLAELARAGMAVLGDCRNGGILVAGGLRLQALNVAGCPDLPEVWWPAEAALPPERGRDGEPPRWRVSRATARALARGHPWILPDAESDDPERLSPGTLVRVVDPAGRILGLARLEGRGRVAARMWTGSAPTEPAPRGRRGRGVSRGRAARVGLDARLPVVDGSRSAQDESVADRVARAIAARRALMQRGTARSQHAGRPFTDAIRLVHGEADRLPGIAVDRLGPLLRILVSGRACAKLVAPIADALTHDCAAELGDAPPIVEVLQLRDAPSRRLDCVRLLRVGPVDVETSVGAESEGRGRLVVHERGLAYLVDPGLHDPREPRPGVGLYLDQRENRERLAKHARRGGRWLNLFAHTGAFSVALLAAGADEVVSVDLSAAYLRWLEENLALNRTAGVDPKRHTSVRRDGRHFLAELGAGDRFDGIVLDPPTAAAAGRRFWSVQRDLAPLLGDALTRLAPGGVLLACRNERAARRPLDDVVRSAAEDRGVRLSGLQPAGPGPDFPSLRGFPEGDSFAGVIARRA